MLEILRWLLGLVALAALLYVPGAAILNSLARRQPSANFFSGRDEWLFTAVLISALVSGGLGFVLAEIGAFYWWSVLLLALFFSLAIAVGLGRASIKWRLLLALLNVPPAPPTRRAEHPWLRAQRIALLALIVVAAALFARPAEMLRGALDSGVYVNAGVALGRTGSIFQHDLLMRQLNDDTGETRELVIYNNPDRYTLDRLRMSGFYIYDKQAALVLPQHYSLYPVWIGLLYTLFGVWGALYATPLLALLGVLAVYFFARRTLTPGAALLVLALLVVCPVTIWFARYPVSEILQQFLLFAGLFAFLRMVQLKGEPYPAGGVDRADSDISRAEDAHETWASLWGTVAGLALGEIMLARPDFIFYLAPVPVYLLYWRLARKWWRPYTWFAATMGVMLAFYLLYFAVYSFGYTMDLYFNVIQDVRRLWGPLLAGVYLLVIAVALLDRLYLRVRPLWSRLESWSSRYRWVWAGGLALAVLAYVAYQYGWAPWQPNFRADSAGNPIPQAFTTTWDSYIGAPVDQGSRYNLLRIGWYLSPLGIIAGTLGLLRWVWSKLSAATWLFFGALLVVSFAFVQETYTEAHYIYTMRRYVPIILPALIIGFAWFCQFFWSRLRPRALGYVVGWSFAVALLAFFIYTSRVIIPHVEEQGALNELSALAANFQGKSVVIFSNERDEPYVVATPLQYVFGVESFVLSPSYPGVNNNALEQAVVRWQKQGYTVWVMMGANGGKLRFPNFSLQEVGSWQWSVPELEQLYNQKPSNIFQAYLPFGIYKVVPAAPPPSLPFSVTMGQMDYQWLVGGFYTQEREQPTAPYWRWTSAQGIMRVPWPSQTGGNTLQGGKVTLRLRPETPVAGRAPRRTQPLTVTLTLDNTPIGQVNLSIGSDFADYTVSAPPGLAKNGSDPGYAILTIKSPTWSGADAGNPYDTRTLGVQVQAVRVSP